MIRDSDVQSVFMSVPPPVRGFIVDRYLNGDTHVLVMYANQVDGLTDLQRTTMATYLKDTLVAIRSLGVQCKLEKWAGSPPMEGLDVIN